MLKTLDLLPSYSIESRSMSMQTLLQAEATYRATPYTTTVTLSPVAPFDFTQSLHFIGEFTPTQAEQALDTQTLTKAIRVLGQTVVFRLQNSGAIAAPALTCTIYSDQPVTSAIQAAVCDRVRFFLSLDDDVTPFYALGQQDPPFATVIRRLYGYHQVKFLTPFENSCWAILTQRTPLPVAKSLKERLTTTFGGALTVDGLTFWAFPTADDLAASDPETLTSLVGNGRKAIYLTSAIMAFRQVEEIWLRTAPYAEVNAWLRAIKGIGEWSALFVLLRGLGRMEKTLVDDSRSGFSYEMLKAAERIYGPLTFVQLQTLAHGYGDWQGYWGHYLRALRTS